MVRAHACARRQAIVNRLQAVRCLPPTWFSATACPRAGARPHAARPHHLPSREQEKKKKYEPPPPPPRVGKKQRRRDGASSLGTKLPTITPTAKCKLRLLKLERVKDWLLMEEEFVQNQEQLKPADERNEEERTKVRGPSTCRAWLTRVAGGWAIAAAASRAAQRTWSRQPEIGTRHALRRHLKHAATEHEATRHQADRAGVPSSAQRLPCWRRPSLSAPCRPAAVALPALQVDDLRGTPLSVGTLEEMIDENHAIVSSAGACCPPVGCRPVSVSVHIHAAGWHDQACGLSARGRAQTKGGSHRKQNESWREAPPLLADHWLFSVRGG